LIHSTHAAGANSDSKKQWEGTLDKLKVTAYKLRYEQGNKGAQKRSLQTGLEANL
jgi:hypothetical protein